MSEQTVSEQQIPFEAQRLEELQAENERLRQQLEALQAADQDRHQREQRLQEQEKANHRLRQELADKALKEAVRTAAEDVGIEPDLAMLQAHRFQCSVGEDGLVRIEPNPTETFLKLSKTDPVFRRNNKAVAEGRKHRAAIDGAAAVDAADAVDLIGFLDRNPTRRYEFIQKHGKGKFFELLRTAKRKGYRRSAP
ncbi:MAG: hypothetical protein AMJ81_09260 [Phycisphaerae bacterium SM23_33]|nr:MAG: hypothetical protein AMJ81_09260 [Phycisphaerae bacterium SM23_33]